MNAERAPEELLVELGRKEAARIVAARLGTGASVDDPCRLGAMHALLAPMTEKFLVSSIYGKEDHDWFDAGRKYYKCDTICEQRVRLAAERKPKQDWAVPGGIYGLFFDISELTHEAPIPDAVKQLLMRGPLQMPLRDTTLVSRFPLIEIRARNAVEAARIIGGHLRAAEAQGWRLGCAEALVDKWRNEYELTKGNEKTVMQFDMRPCLLSDSLPNLIALTMLAAQPKLEEALQEFEQSKSRPAAVAAVGATLKEATSKEMEHIRRPNRSSPSSARAADIAFDRREKSIDWNKDALLRYWNQNVELMGESSTLEIPANDLVSLLMMAKGLLEWKGAGHLFQPTQNGFALTLQDGQTINRSDAAELSAVLTAFSQNHPDVANLHKTIRLLVAHAAAGGFSIKCERSPLPPPPHPPPLPTPNQRESPQWFYYVNQQQHGPVSQQSLTSMIEDGTIDRETIARPADDSTEGGWTIESLQRSKTLPPVRRVFPALPPNASKAQRIIRAFEEKHGKLLTEMTASQLSNFTHEVTRNVPWNMAIAFFKDTTAEPVLRRARWQYNGLFVKLVLFLVLVVGFGIAAALWLAAHPVGH